MFPPVFQPPNRPLKFARRGRNQNLFGVDHLFAPETAAQARRRHANLFQANTERAGQNRTQHLRQLRATFHMQPLAIIDELRRHSARFQGNRGLPVEFISPANHQIAFARGEIGVAVDSASLDKRHWFPSSGYSKGAPASLRRHMVGNRRKRFVIDFDKRRRVFREIAICRHDQRHRLPHVANPFPGDDAMAHVQRSGDHVHAREARHRLNPNPLPSGRQSLPDSPARVLSESRARGRAPPWIARCRFRLHSARRKIRQKSAAPLARVRWSSARKTASPTYRRLCAQRHGSVRLLRHSFPLTAFVILQAPSARRTAVQIFR